MPGPPLEGRAVTAAAFGLSDLLAATNDLCYLVDLDGRILAVSEGSWRRFANANDAPQLTTASVVAKNLFDFIAGPTIRAAYRALHQRLAAGASPVSFRLRCDAPARRRELLRSITPLRHVGAVRALFYQSVLLREQERLAMRLLTRLVATEDVPCPASRTAASATACAPPRRTRARRG